MFRAWLSSAVVFCTQPSVSLVSLSELSRFRDLWIIPVPSLTQSSMFRVAPHLQHPDPENKTGADHRLQRRIARGREREKKREKGEEKESR